MLISCLNICHQLWLLVKTLAWSRFLPLYLNLSSCSETSLAPCRSPSRWSPPTWTRPRRRSKSPFSINSITTTISTSTTISINSITTVTTISINFILTFTTLTIMIFRSPWPPPSMPSRSSACLRRREGESSWSKDKSYHSSKLTRRQLSSSETIFSELTTTVVGIDHSCLKKKVECSPTFKICQITLLPIVNSVHCASLQSDFFACHSIIKSGWYQSFKLNLYLLGLKSSDQSFWMLMENSICDTVGRLSQARDMCFMFYDYLSNIKSDRKMKLILISEHMWW